MSSPAPRDPADVQLRAYLHGGLSVDAQLDFKTAIGATRPADRQAWLLHVAGFSTREIARRCNTYPMEISRRIKRARQAVCESRTR